MQQTMYVRIVHKIYNLLYSTSTSFATRYGFVRNDLLQISIAITEAILMTLTSSSSGGRVLQ